MKKRKQAVPGEWLVYCDVCKRTYLASQVRKRWDGFIVCDDDYETRHEGDKPTPHVHDNQQPPFTRPRPQYTELDEVTIDGHSTWESYLNVN